VEIPNQKRLETALTCAALAHVRRAVRPAEPRAAAHARRYIYGIGATTAKAILVETVRRRLRQSARLHKSHPRLFAPSENREQAHARAV
jgi:hypothetical protein